MIAVDRTTRATTVNTSAASPMFEKNLGGEDLVLCEYVEVY